MKVMLGKILIEGDKTYFVSKDNVQIPVVLEGKRKKWVEGKDHIAIYKEFEGKGKYYLDLVSTRNTIEELIYHIDFDNENQKAQLKTFSEPSFDPASINEHIEKSPYNKVMVGLYYCPDGKKFKLNNVSFIVHRKSEDAYLSAEEYRAKIAKEVGNKLLRLQNAVSDRAVFRTLGLTPSSRSASFLRRSILVVTAFSSFFLLVTHSLSITSVVCLFPSFV